MPLVRSLTLSAVLSLLLAGAVSAQGPVYPATPPSRGALYADRQTDLYLLGGTWLYRPDGTDVGMAQGWWRDAGATDGWSTTTVPNAYNAGDLTPASMAGYVGWYRRDFVVPAGAFPSYVTRAQQHWIVRFESANYRATVWLNGHLLGSHTGEALPFEFDLGNLRQGVNRIIVRVDNRRTPADLPPGPGGLWWNYGGLLREVYLRPVARADIAQVQVRPLLACPNCPATIQEQVLIRNAAGVAQTVHLAGRYGAATLDFGARTLAPHAIWTARAQTVISHPRLWSLDHPALYRATLSLTDGKGRPLTGYFTYSGIRSITVTAGGRLELNGRLLNLRGVDFHEQNIGTGAALSPAQLAQLIAWVRQIGAKVIRVHYPFNPQILQMADRYGILVWSEVPVYQLHSQYLAAPGTVALAHQLLRENILANQNHPSILLWSVGNELPTPPTPPEASYIAGAATLAHRLDPTRPVGMAISDWPGVPCQGAYAPLDVIGFNDYFGWFDAGGGSTDDRSALGPFLDSLHACYPRKAIFVSEFGFEANRHGPVEERGTYEFQQNAIAYHLGVFASKPWLSGAMYWVLQDFAAAPTWGGGDPLPDPPWVQKGLLDPYGNQKPAFSQISAAYHAWRQVAPATKRGS